MQTGMLYRSVTVDGLERLYALYVPREYRPGTPWPCVVFLNGSGECGTDGQRQLTQGLFPAMLNAKENWPMIAVFPQKPDRSSTWLDHDALVMAALARTREEWNIDPARIYLTGLSQGGAGAWAIAARHADVFAAIAPICGYSDPAALASNLQNMPVWAFHGLKDDIVPPEHTRNMIAAIEQAGGRTAETNPPPGSTLAPHQQGSLRMTLFPDLNHGCWDRAYRDMDVGEWLLGWRKR